MHVIKSLENEEPVHFRQPKDYIGFYSHTTAYQTLDSSTLGGKKLAADCLEEATTSLAAATIVTNEKQNHSVGFKGEGTISRVFLSFSKCINKDGLAICDNTFDARITSYYGIATTGNRMLKDKKMVANPHPESYGIYCQIFDTLVDMKWKEKDAILELSTKKRNLY
ncbi:hypothetical protein V6N13_055510 [Hibiscus sabdariffa]|uniref:Uncharacterized protein n=2 Tax=Hibiscus sabdariffa TaxID=183260 RepID=A0ABR2NU00_9ROSI